MRLTDPDHVWNHPSRPTVFDRIKSARFLVYEVRIQERFKNKPTAYFWKEMGEAYAVVNKVKNDIPPGGIVWDFAAGHGLAGIFMALFRKDVKVALVDIREHSTWPLWRELLGDRVLTLQRDLGNMKPREIEDISQTAPIAAIGVHACKWMSPKIIELASRVRAELIALMPCCAGFKYLSPTALRALNFIDNYIDNDYHKWVLGLALMLNERNYKVNISEVSWLKKLTPKATIIRAYLL